MQYVHQKSPFSWIDLFHTQADVRVMTNVSVRIFWTSFSFSTSSNKCWFIVIRNSPLVNYDPYKNLKPYCYKFECNLSSRKLDKDHEEIITIDGFCWFKQRRILLMSQLVMQCIFCMECNACNRIQCMTILAKVNIPA